MALEGDSFYRIHAAFVAGDLDDLRRQIGHLGDFPDVSPDAAIGLPLVYAIYHSPLAFVRELLDAGADPNGTDGDGFPPLIAAVSGTTPVAGATLRSDSDQLVELLLSRGADIEQRGIDDDTALHLVAGQGDVAMVELLLEHGADPNQLRRIDDMETPLELAEQAGHRDAADRLRPVTTGFDWQRATAGGEIAVLRRMRLDGHDIDAKDGQGMTALMRAAHAGRQATVEWLVSQSADLDHTSKFGLSALMLAVIGNHDEVTRILVRAGADVSIEGAGAPGFAGKTAADLAEQAGDIQLAADIRGGTR